MTRALHPGSLAIRGRQDAATEMYTGAEARIELSEQAVPAM